MRGKEQRFSYTQLQARITPACAGKSSEHMRKSGTNGDHPRMCGEKFRAYAKIWNEWGSPPHVRGKAIEVGQFCALGGITPACAGKSRIRAGRGAAFGDHPPPAYAGKSKIRRKGRWQHRDHPRVCGEKTQIGQVVHPDWGSPPHVRGKGLYVIVSRDFQRITPACAGKSLWRWQHRQSDWDHPRMCGEKYCWTLIACLNWGSSPHVRGKD